MNESILSLASKITRDNRDWKKDQAILSFFFFSIQDWALVAFNQISMIFVNSSESSSSSFKWNNDCLNIFHPRSLTPSCYCCLHWFTWHQVSEEWFKFPNFRFFSLKFYPTLFKRLINANSSMGCERPCSVGGGMKSKSRINWHRAHLRGGIMALQRSTIETSVHPE